MHLHDVLEFYQIITEQSLYSVIILGKHSLFLGHSFFFLLFLFKF